MYKPFPVKILTTPIKDNTPEAISVIVIISNNEETQFLKKVAEKCSFNHSKFAFQLSSLSNPDCVKRIAMNNTDKTFTRVNGSIPKTVGPLANEEILNKSIRKKIVN